MEKWGETTADWCDRAPGSTRKALVLLILVTTTIAPLILSTVLSANTSQNQEMTKSTSSHESQASITPMPLEPKLLWKYETDYDNTTNYGSISNSLSATTAAETGGGDGVGDGSLLIIVAGVAVVPAVVISIAVLIVRKRRVNQAVTEDKEYVDPTKIRSRSEEGTYSLETSNATTGSTGGEKVSIEELSVTGTTLKVYWSLLSKRPDSAGFREIQKKLGFSSPSSALYQLDKLVRLGLLEKDAMGDYAVRRIVKFGLLSNFLYIGKHTVPKNAVYGSMTFLINSICAVLLMIVGLPPVANLALLPGVISSVVFFYEASKAWKYKRKVFEVADKQFERRGVKRKT